MFSKLFSKMGDENEKARNEDAERRKTEEFVEQRKRQAEANKLEAAHKKEEDEKIMPSIQEDAEIEGKSPDNVGGGGSILLPDGTIDPRKKIRSQEQQVRDLKLDYKVPKFLQRKTKNSSPSSRT